MDFSENARELEIEETEYLSLLRLFETHAKKDLANLRSALNEENLTAVREAAHSIKGASGSLNLWDIHEAAERICTLAHEEIVEPIGAQAAIIVGGLDNIAESLAAETGGE